MVSQTSNIKLMQNKVLDAMERLGLMYFDRKKIVIANEKIIIYFCLPRNSLYKLVEFCKLNKIGIAYDNGRIELFNLKYDKYDLDQYY
jgi:hypothetical protein